MFIICSSFPHAPLTAKNVGAVVYILPTFQVCKILSGANVGGKKKAGGGVVVEVLCEGSPKKSSGPSMLVVVAERRWRRLHAKHRLAAADMYAAHREIQAWRAAGRSMLGVGDVFIARQQAQEGHCFNALPAPASVASTTSRARTPPPCFGCVRSLARRSACEVSGETKVKRCRWLIGTRSPKGT